MALIAVAIVTLISMAGLSIDLGTLYVAKAEAQRAADAAALTAARTISISGITGDPNNSASSWQPVCGGSTSLATLAATTVAQQNLISSTAANTINVYYGTNGGVGTNTDCTSAGTAFGVNPIVTVNVQRTNLPIYFARVFSLFGGRYSGSIVSASGTAEAFNPSNSGSITPSGALIPVQPRCVKPWMVPNQDPGNKALPFVLTANGSIQNPGVSPAGVIGETFSLVADCKPGGRRCQLANPSPPSPQATAPSTLQYVPGEASNPSIAIAANRAISGCSQVQNADYWDAVAGCDQTTKYACGTQANTVELTDNPWNDSVNAAQCLINATDANASTASGQDYLNPASPYPFQIQAGSNSALVAAGIASGSIITSSPSIVSLPIYDSNATPKINAFRTTPVTVVGFLQVFINSVNSAINPVNGVPPGGINVTVMNVAGCGNGQTTTVSSPPCPNPLLPCATSPVPVRLITPP
jgi:Flp pilus assembly protein TadG